MPERNILRYCVILTAVFVAAVLAGFYAPIPGFGGQVRQANKMFFLVALPLVILVAFIETVLMFSMGGVPPH
jgi:hypothetical protein